MQREHSSGLQGQQQPAAGRDEVWRGLVASNSLERQRSGEPPGTQLLRRMSRSWSRLRLANAASQSSARLEEAIAEAEHQLALELQQDTAAAAPPPPQQQRRTVLGSVPAFMPAAADAAGTSASARDASGRGRALLPAGAQQQLLRPPPVAAVTVLAGYDHLTGAEGGNDSTASSDVSRLTPCRVHVLDGADEEAAAAQPGSKKQQQRPQRGAGTPVSAAAVLPPQPPSRRLLPVRCAAAAVASATHLWRARRGGVITASLLGLAVLGLVIGLAIGLSTRGGGAMQPWWASGGSAGAWLPPTGDAQLDSLLRLRQAVDSNGALADAWRVDSGLHGGFCRWPGITCNATRHVTAINLTSETYLLTLSGVLPPGEALSGLPGLRALDVRDHHISGPLPDDYASLALEELRLDRNRLSGPLPPAWFAGSSPLATHLTVLTAYNNSLSGPLPDATDGGMKRLRQLDLSLNAFSGPLPASWAGMGALRELWLAVNQLSGPLPAAWGDLAALRKLVLSENGLSGSLPPSWGAGMTALRELWLEYNQLSGELPDSFGRLAALRTLALNNNQLQGPIPASWSGPGLGTSLAAPFFFNNSELSGCLPVEWWPRLRDAGVDAQLFLFGGTGLTGFCDSSSSSGGARATTPTTAAVTSASTTTATTSTDSNQVPTTTVPEQPPGPPPRPGDWGAHPSGPPVIRQQLPDSTPAPEPAAAAEPGTAAAPATTAPAGAAEPAPTPAVQPEPPAAVPAVATAEGQLQALLLLKQAVDPAGLLPWTAAEGGSFCGWPQVTCDAGGVVRGINLTIDADEPLLSGVLPSDAALSGLPGLEVLDVRRHAISGPLPPAWRVPSLQRLLLARNRLSGPLPAAWAASLLSGGPLTELDLAHNQLSGPLPAAWGSSGSAGLTSLDLSFNALTGPLPAEWGAAAGGLASLRVLRLAVNNLSGPLPPSWSGLRELRELSLSENTRLTGPVPPAWFAASGMAALQVLSAEYCNLTGPLPDGDDGGAPPAQLAAIALNDNALTGGVPASWGGGGLPRLRALFLHNNPGLGGCLPEGLTAQLCGTAPEDAAAGNGAGSAGAADVDADMDCAVDDLQLGTQLAGNCAPAAPAAS